MSTCKTCKGFLKSKTFWLNLVGGALAVVNALQGVIPGEYAAVTLSVLNILNRVFTTKPLSEK